MNSLFQLMLSSVGRKILMGTSGLLVIGFLLVHFIGNLFIYAGPEAFNHYAFALSKNGVLFFVMESVLALLFLWHIVLGINLYFYGNSARKEEYVMKRHSGRGATFASSTMPYTGSLILIFIVLHIWHFRLGPIYSVTYDGVMMRDLYKLVLEFFASPYLTFFYVASMCCIGVHISHGFQSAFQSLGVSHPKLTPIIKIVGYLFIVIVVVGFSSFPVWAYIQSLSMYTVSSSLFK